MSESHGNSFVRDSVERACQHCGALTYADVTCCAQCGRFPIKLRLCVRCRTISDASDARCWRCGHLFAPDGEFL